MSDKTYTEAEVLTLLNQQKDICADTYKKTITNPETDHNFTATWLLIKQAPLALGSK